MFIAISFLLFAAPQKPKSALSANDTAFLTRIDKAVSRMSDKKTAFLHFEKVVTKADAIRCNQLQAKVAPNSGYYADCAFVQAWYGIDYAANLQRITRPYRLWKTNSSRWEKEYTQANDNVSTDIDSCYSLLNWLYLKHHDLKSLGAWEDLTLDGAPAEGSGDDLYELWDSHAKDMLRAAYGHPRRINNLAETLNWGHEEAGDKDHTKEEIADVRPYLRSKDKRVASAAQSLVETLRSGKWVEAVRRDLPK